MISGSLSSISRDKFSKIDCFTKIVSTLGPASSDKEVIKDLALAGADVFRLNFSHGDICSHERNVKYIREISQEIGKDLGILADMQGPKLRIGSFKGGSIFLSSGSKFRLDMKEEEGDTSRVNLPHKEIFSVMYKGMPLLLNDGKIRLKVLEYGSDYADIEVEVGGELSDHKGVNVPGVSLPLSSLTEKDLKDLELALDFGVDWIGLSFVQRPEDVEQARLIIKDRAWIISKIEKPSAIDSLEKIIELSDGIMVARGDLGVELPIEQVPVLQKKIVYSCRQAGKPVIVATQMLESMINNPTPTRAEASDVATAVFDGADAVMLSGETAVGKYPVEAVRTMDKVIRNVESIPMYNDIISLYQGKDAFFEKRGLLKIEEAITFSAREVSRNLPGASAIVTYTESGSTSLRAAKERPCLPILSITPYLKVSRRMSLVWGVISRRVEDPLHTFDDIGKTAIKSVKEAGISREGDKIIITAGIPFSHKGNTNTLYITVVD